MTKRLRIPNEDVTFHDHELAITQTRTFQRLFFLKQLGLAYLVYPGATHTRGHHSIRCLSEADKILKAIKVDGPDAGHIRVAALLHDIGHVPFSHTLEDEHVILGKHDRQERLDATLRHLKHELDPRHVSIVEQATSILLAISGAKEATPDWKSDLVGNTVCADLLAYITMDAEWTGIMKRPGYYRIYEYFDRVNDRLCIKLTKGGLRTDIVSAIMDLLDMRYALTERVIFHHAKCIASAMLARAARLCELSEKSELLKMGDEVFLEYLEALAKKKSAGALRLLEGLRARRLYQRIFKVGRQSRDAWDESREPGAFASRWRNGQEVEQLLTEVECAHELSPGSLVLWCPEGKAGMKLVRAQVVWESSDRLCGPAELRSELIEKQFPGVHKRVTTIEDQYLDLWAFWIAIDRRFIQKAASVMLTLEERIGVKCDPVFVETYLQKLPEFKECLQKRTLINRTLQRLEPQIEANLPNQVAADGIPLVNTKLIIKTTKFVLDSTEMPAQPHLFGDRLQPGSAKQEVGSSCQQSFERDLAKILGKYPRFARLDNSAVSSWCRDNLKKIRAQEYDRFLILAKEAVTSEVGTNFKPAGPTGSVEEEMMSFLNWVLNNFRTAEPAGE